MPRADQVLMLGGALRHSFLSTCASNKLSTLGTDTLTHALPNKVRTKLVVQTEIQGTLQQRAST